MGNSGESTRYPCSSATKLNCAGEPSGNVNLRERVDDIKVITLLVSIRVGYLC